MVLPAIEKQIKQVERRKLYLRQLNVFKTKSQVLVNLLDPSKILHNILQNWMENNNFTSAMWEHPSVFVRLQVDTAECVENLARCYFTV